VEQEIPLQLLQYKVTQVVLDHQLITQVLVVVAELVQQEVTHLLHLLQELVEKVVTVEQELLTGQVIAQ
jgi:hypothetical protein